MADPIKISREEFQPPSDDILRAFEGSMTDLRSDRDERTGAIPLQPTERVTAAPVMGDLTTAQINAIKKELGDMGMEITADDETAIAP